MILLVRRWVVRLTRRLAARLGYDLVLRSVYSPVPAIPPATSPVWQRASSLSGLEVGPQRQLAFLEGDLARYLDEFEPPPGFHLWNDYYQSVDAEVLYAMIRHFRPRQVLEIGSGYSTLVIEAACRRNASEGRTAEIVAVDPEPRRGLDMLRGSVVTIREPAQELPVERFLELEQNDVLFVDSSHTVKLGSEVNLIVLEVLPRLREGVVVHFHDVFLPYEYPRHWYERGTYLAEQYARAPPAAREHDPEPPGAAGLRSDGVLAPQAQSSLRAVNIRLSEGLRPRGTLATLRVGRFGRNATFVRRTPAR